MHFKLLHFTLTFCEVIPIFVNFFSSLSICVIYFYPDTETATCYLIPLSSLSRPTSSCVFVFYFTITTGSLDIFVLFRSSFYIDDVFMCCNISLSCLSILQLILMYLP